MYRVEMIAKQSVMADIRQSWINSGREDNAEHGVFIFDRADVVHWGEGVFQVISKGKHHLYNIADFYRITVEEVE